ncbi:MAG: phosphatidate cytidylyltransferase, partial [Clostridiales bacterium]|nr:phosphatidate cytidylyltransferase [Clostridiales bacterium]
MKVRIISATIAVALLLVIMYFGKVTIGLTVFILAVIGIREFYLAMESGGYKPVKTAGYLFCLPLLYIGVLKDIPAVKERMDSVLKNFTLFEGFALCVFLLIAVLFCLLIFKNDVYKPADMALTVFGIIYVSFLFSFIILTRNMEFGGLYLGFALIGAFLTDTAAYFTGVTIGKNKILPAISPKKTLEGSIGGVVGCVAGITAYGFFIMRYTGSIAVYHLIIIGLLCGFVSQIGDW